MPHVVHLQQTLKPNAPCFCGSKRKYKKCCHIADLSLVAGKESVQAGVSKQEARNRRRAEAAKALKKRKADAKATANAKATDAKATDDAKAITYAKTAKKEAAQHVASEPSPIKATKTIISKPEPSPKSPPKPPPKSRYVPPHLRAQAKKHANNSSESDSQKIDSGGSMLPVVRLELLAATTSALCLCVTVSRARGFLWRLELCERSEKAFASAHGVDLGSLLDNAEVHKPPAAPIRAEVRIDAVDWPIGPIPLKSGRHYQVRVMVARDGTNPESEHANKEQKLDWECCSHQDTVFRVSATTSAPRPPYTGICLRSCQPQTHLQLRHAIMFRHISSLRRCWRRRPPNRRG